MSLTRKQTVLVTGGAGYIGSHTVHALIEANFDVIVLDNLSTGYIELLHPKAQFLNLDLLNTDQIIPHLSSKNIIGIIHFAAKIVIPESVANPLSYYESNTFGVVSILKIAKILNIKHLVFSSTAAIYDSLNFSYVDENSPSAPLNPYGFSKYFSEQIIRDSEKEFPLSSVIFRYFNVAGAHHQLLYGQRSPTSTHLIKVCSEAALNKRAEVFITGTDFPTPDGSGVRDFIHVEDLAHAHVLALQYLLDGGKSNIFNCGYGEGHSVREVIRCMQKVSQNQFKTSDAPRRLGDSASLVANADKIKKVLSWVPKHNDLEFICKTAYLFERSF